MKTTFSYFPGMLENPAPAKIILKNKKIEVRLKRSKALIFSRIPPLIFRKTLPLSKITEKIVVHNFIV